MAFEGDLTNLGLADIFQTLGMNRQSGTLVVKYGDTERRFYFTDDGASLLTSRSARKFRLGNLLVGLGKLSDADLKVAVLKQERAKETKLGDILIQTGLVKNEDIKEACRYQAAEEIYDSFNWKSGKFQFLEGANAGPESGPGPFAEFFFGVTDIVMEAARRSDEYGLNVQKIGDLDEFWVRKEGASPSEEDVGRPAVMLHQMLDGTMDVRQVFDEFHLSPFDTCLAFAALVDKGFIQPMDSSGLETAAKPFLEKKDFARAAKLLSRASHSNPKNGVLLQGLADAQAAAGDKKQAAATLASLGRLYAELDQRTEAVEALHKAVLQDNRLESAYEQLMEIHASLDQFEKSEEACREASRLMSDDRNFDGALKLLDRGLQLIPESVNLRIQRANCLLAMGQKDQGLKELRDIALAMEEKKADHRVVLGVFRKLLQLDPENKEFKARVDGLVAGEKARETRKKLVRVGAAAGVIALVGVAFVFRPRSASERLAAADKVLLENPNYESAKALYEETSAAVDGVLASAGPDSEVGVRATKIKAEIDLRRNSKERSGKVAALKKRIKELVIDPATALVQQGDYPAGVRKTLEVFAVLADPSAAALKGKEFDQMSKGALTDTKAVLVKASDALRAQWKDVLSASGVVGSIEIPKADDEHQRQVFDVAENALKARDRIDWKGTVEALNEAARKFGQVEGLRLEEIRRTVDGMDSTFGAISEKYDEARAAVARREVLDLYRKTLKDVGDAKNTGVLQKGIEQCESFLKRCEALRKEEPKKYFGPVV